MSLDRHGTLFDENYYRHCCGEPYARNEIWMGYFRRVAQGIAREIHPKTVLDAGCAWGFLVENLRLEGIEAFGVDISAYAIQQAYAGIKPYLWEGSVTDPLPRRYDLIVSIEVLEHIPQAESEQAVANLCRYTDDVLFSSTPFDQTEATHFNVQPPEYWAEQFARQGFYRDLDFDASFLTPWAMRYRRTQEPVPRLVHEYERKLWALKTENADIRKTVEDVQSQANEREKELQAQVNAWEARWADLEKSLAWKIIAPLKKIRQIFPGSSNRSNPHN